MGVIRDTTYIHHLLELDNLGYIEPTTLREDSAHAERMREFRQHKDHLSNSDHADISWIDLGQSRAGNFSYGIYPGLVVCPTNSDAVPFAQPYRGLRCYQLASRNRGVIQKSWGFDDAGVEYVSYVADIELDLLVLFERLHNGEAGKLHLRSLRYGTEHPGAFQATLSYAPRNRNPGRLVMNAQVDRKVIAMTIVISSSTFQLVVWDWTMGVELTASKIPRPCLIRLNFSLIKIEYCSTRRNISLRFRTYVCYFGANLTKITRFQLCGIDKSLSIYQAFRRGLTIESPRGTFFVSTIIEQPILRFMDVDALPKCNSVNSLPTTHNYDL